MKSTLTALAVFAACGGAAFAQSGVPKPINPSAAAPAEIVRPATVTADIKGVGGKVIGKAILTDAPDGAILRIEMTAGALTPGWHGLHLHEKGDCSDAAFTTAGGHVGHGVGGKQHGLLNSAGPEFGDLPNLYAPAAKTPFGAEVFSTLVVLGDAPVAGRAPLQDTDGSAIVIHANADDQKSQPIGNAGARVACAVIKK
jgi:Cu-Zn family superoxide dismutase